MDEFTAEGVCGTKTVVSCVGVVEKGCDAVVGRHSWSGEDYIEDGDRDGVMSDDGTCERKSTAALSWRFGVAWRGVVWCGGASAKSLRLKLPVLGRWWFRK